MNFSVKNIDKTTGIPVVDGASFIKKRVARVFMALSKESGVVQRCQICGQEVFVSGSISIRVATCLNCLKCKEKNYT